VEGAATLIFTFRIAKLWPTPNQNRKREVQVEVDVEEKSIGNDKKYKKVASGGDL